MIRSSDPLIPPFRFAIVEEGLLRGSYPTDRNFRFLKRLKLKTIVSLTPKPPTKSFYTFCERYNTTTKHFTVSKFKDDVTLSAAQVAQLLEMMIEPNNLPMYIHCLDGANVTGTIFMCLRKLQNWNLSSIFQEFTRFTRGGTIASSEAEFVETFKAEIDVSPQIPPWLWQGIRMIKHPTLKLRLVGGDQQPALLALNNTTSTTTTTTTSIINPSSSSTIISNTSSLPSSSTNTPNRSTVDDGGNLLQKLIELNLNNNNKNNNNSSVHGIQVEKNEDNIDTVENKNINKPSKTSSEGGENKKKTNELSSTTTSIKSDKKNKNDNIKNSDDNNSNKNNNDNNNNESNNMPSSITSNISTISSTIVQSTSQQPQQSMTPSVLTQSPRTTSTPLSSSIILPSGSSISKDKKKKDDIKLQFDSGKFMTQKESRSIEALSLERTVKNVTSSNINTTTTTTTTTTFTSQSQNQSPKNSHRTISSSQNPNLN
ncbi:hypothetical protein RB653_000586 [Dictyostelium firmibasis]|uniref:Uncharacterized protein n=1 Tax=Dictyostelium firmibasis TaxID=79012 RepID=A0AAN7YW19_9MYCE